MPQKKVFIQGVGEVTLNKRRGGKNLRISISASGAIRVSMPIWVPYQAGIKYATTNQRWIAEHINNIAPIVLRDGDSIGRQHKLLFINRTLSHKTISTRVSGNYISVISSLPALSTAVQDKAAQASELALKKEANAYLPTRLSELSKTLGYKYGKVKCRKLSSRWGSCSDRGDITLNIFLMQLPDDLIDYILVHELVHTVHKHHQKGFWDELGIKRPGYPAERAKLKTHRPRLEPTN